MNAQYKEIEEIIKILSNCSFRITNEKKLQEDINYIFNKNNLNIEREFKLDEESIVDFFKNGIAIEIKIKGNAKKIYKQCERYCKNALVDKLILVSSKPMGFPEEINGKDCYFVDISSGFLL